MHQILLAVVAFLLVSVDAFGETVSIISNSESLSSNLVEAALTRNLRAEGYTVKGGTNEGVVILLSVMELKNRSGLKPGVAGHVSIVTSGWQNVADNFGLSASCKSENEIARTINDMVGTRLILLDGYIAAASNEEELAEMLATASNKVLRLAFRKMQEFLDEIEKTAREKSSRGGFDPAKLKAAKAREQSSRVINPMR